MLDCSTPHIIGHTASFAPTLGEVTIGVVTALEIEYAAIKQVLGSTTDVAVPATAPSRPTSTYALAAVPSKFGGHHTVAITMLPDMGNNIASSVATSLLHDCPNIQHLIMCGIAGAVPCAQKAADHVRLGDIVISNRGGVIQYDYVKETGKTKRARWKEHRHAPRPPSAPMLGAVKQLEADHLAGRRPWETWISESTRELEAHSAGWTRPDEEYDRLHDWHDALPPTEHPVDASRRAGYPRVFTGTIASANTLLKDAAKRDRLRDRFGIKAVEMEASGIADASWLRGVGYIIVRGTCDYCNHEKGDYWQRYASVAAAAYTRAIIEAMPPACLPSSEMTAATASSARPQHLWNVPYGRNAFFTGREDVLSNLSDIREPSSSAATPEASAPPATAIVGLGGIGKTQVAVEYAYRTVEKYGAVFWADSNSEAALDRAFLEIAELLNLPEKDDANSDNLRAAVTQWLGSNSDYLLILNNADAPDILRQFVPAEPGGRLLVTSRYHNLPSIGIYHSVEIAVLSATEAERFLLIRTGRPHPEHVELTAARELAHELGGLPLALEQAAAFITNHNVRFSDYLVSYRKRRLTLLEVQLPQTGPYDHTVLTTWSLNFDMVETDSPAAADVLRVSAFLGSDRIPEELLTLGAAHFGDAVRASIRGVETDPLRLDAVLHPLSEYSLIHRRLDGRAFDVHRLVQEVIRYRMDEPTRRDFAERAIRVMNASVPDPVHEMLPRWQRLLPHVMIAVEHVEIWNYTSLDAARLLSHTGLYFYVRGEYTSAEPLLARSLTMAESLLGLSHPHTAAGANNLGALYNAQGKFGHAERLFRRALEINRRIVPPNHLDIASNVGNLGSVYQSLVRYADAESMFLEALTIRETHQGPNNHEVAICLGNLANLYRIIGRYEQAQELHERANTINARFLGGDHPDAAFGALNMAALYESMGRIDDADSLYSTALQIFEREVGPSHPKTALCLNNIAGVRVAQGRYQDAEVLYLRALDVRERVLGPIHPDIAASLSGLARTRVHMGRLEDAEPLYQRSLEICELTHGIDHPDTAACLDVVADLHATLGRRDSADQFARRALAIRKQTFGDDHLITAASLNSVGNVCSARRRFADAETLYRQALDIRERTLGAQHPDTATSLHNLANACLHLGKGDDAEEAYKRALGIRQRSLGPDHRDTVATMNGLGDVLDSRKRYREAESVYRQVLDARMRILGPDHYETATVLHNLCLTCLRLNRLADAEAYCLKALRVWERSLGPDHLHTGACLNSLAAVYSSQYRDAEAADLCCRALGICQLVLGSDDRETVAIRGNYVRALSASRSPLRKFIGRLKRKRRSRSER